MESFSRETPEDLLCEQSLSEKGLEIKKVKADCNSFFRAIADQVDGDELAHGKYRRFVVSHMTNKREKYENEKEIHGSFDKYINRIKQLDSTFGS
jgi:hypothetical protein